MNGTVKVVLVAGFSVVFGFYAFMIQGMNNKILQVGDQKSYYTEARMNATAGLNHAMYTMRTQSLWWSTGTVYVKNDLLAGGDTVSYIIEKPSSLPADEARVTVTADFNGVTAKQVAVIKNVSGIFSSPCRCQVVKVYVYPYQLPASELPL